jgi:pimeloyl-ACP methyl ester carboxylesterase
MLPVADGAGVPLAYREEGTGQPVLLVHGIAEDAAAWGPAVSSLAGDARVIAYDRRGYGGSGAPEPYERTTVSEQAEDAAALLRALDAAAAVLWGREIGALVCLDLCLRHRPLVAGAVLQDPPLLAFAATATEALAEERVRLEEALRDGGPERAVDAFLDARGEPPDSERRGRARRAHRAVFADFGGLASWPVTRRELRALEAPLAVLSSPGAPAHARAAAESLAGLVPDAEHRTAADPLAAVEDLVGRAG